MRPWGWPHFFGQVKFTSAVKLSEGSATEYGREEEENFFKRLGKWRSGRRNPSKLHHTEDKDGRTLGFPPWPCIHPPLALCLCKSVCYPVLLVHSLFSTIFHADSVWVFVFVYESQWEAVWWHKDNDFVFFFFFCTGCPWLSLYWVPEQPALHQLPKCILLDVYMTSHG